MEESYLSSWLNKTTWQKMKQWALYSKLWKQLITFTTVTLYIWILRWVEFCFFSQALCPPPLSPWWETHWLCKDIFFSGICMHTIWILKSINLSPFATNLNFMGTFIWKSFLFCLPKQLGQLCVANLLMKKSSNKDESINRRFTTATDVGHLPCMKSRWLNLCTECTLLGIEEQSWIG